MEWGEEERGRAARRAGEKDAARGSARSTGIGTTRRKRFGDQTQRKKKDARVPTQRRMREQEHAVRRRRPAGITKVARVSHSIRAGTQGCRGGQAPVPQARRQWCTEYCTYSRAQRPSGPVAQWLSTVQYFAVGCCLLLPPGSCLRAKEGSCGWTASGAGCGQSGPSKTGQTYAQALQSPEIGPCLQGRNDPITGTMNACVQLPSTAHPAAAGGWARACVCWEAATLSHLGLSTV